MTALSDAFSRCPKAVLRDELAREVAWFSEWSWFKRYGQAPFHGGRDDQAPLFIDACDVIEAEIETLKQQAAEKQKSR